MKRTIDQVSQGDAAYRKFMEYWKKVQHGKAYPKQKKILKQAPLLSKFSHNKEMLYVVFDLSQYRVIYFGDNMESIFGYSNSELKRNNILLFFRALVSGQRTFPITIAKWTEKVYNVFLPQSPANEVYFSFCGLQVKHKSGHALSLLVQYTSISNNEQGHSNMGIVTVEDVSHLLKGNFYWARSSCTQTNACVAHYHSKKKTDQLQDIISDREKEVLKLIAVGMTSNEIAELLYIAQNTVNRHRKNMLARTGAKDTTALVHICRRVGII